MLTPKQIEERRTGIGGSDIAAVMGRSPFMTATDVYHLKLDLVEVPETPAMYWGSAAEKMIRERYARDHAGLPEAWLVEIGVETQRDTGHHWLLATPDGLVWGPSDDGGPGRTKLLHGLEIKTAHAFAADQWADGVPEHYAMQCQWYMMVTGLTRWDVAVLIGGNDYREFTLERDDALIAEMFAAAEHFWVEHVEKEVPPEPTTPAECAQQFTSDDGPMLGANAEAEDWAIILYQAQSLVKRTNAAADEAKAYLQAIISDHAGIEGPWGKITWKVNKKGSRTFRCSWNEEWIEGNT